jgi:hypothetical protein
MPSRGIRPDPPFAPPAPPSPRGVEVLIKKSSVDPEFRKFFLTERAAAAQRLGLTLAPSEADLLRVVPEEQLAHMIGAAAVPDHLVGVFLGRSGAEMLKTLEPMRVRPEDLVCTGIQPDYPVTLGITPDRPPPRPTRGAAAPAADIRKTVLVVLLLAALAACLFMLCKEL